MGDGMVYFDGSKVEAYQRVMNYCNYTGREEGWPTGSGRIF